METWLNRHGAVIPLVEQDSARSKGEVEAEIAKAIVRTHREQHGRGPADVRATIVRDMVLARYSGILTSTEARLLGTEEGRRLIRSARHELRSISHREAEDAVAAAAGRKVLRSYADLDVEAAEMIEVFILDGDLESDLHPRPEGPG